MQNYLFFKQYSIQSYPSKIPGGKYRGNHISIEWPEKGKLEIKEKLFSGDKLLFDTRDKAILNCFRHGIRYINQYLN